MTQATYRGIRYTTTARTEANRSNTKLVYRGVAYTK